VSAFFAALLGAALAAILFLAAGGLESVGVEAVPFLPPLSLKWTELPWLLAVPFATALIAWVTARISVLSVVRAIY
jgi:cell division transport system permease protein